MPTYLTFAGLPDLPIGLDDEKSSLVGPLYRAVNSLAQQLAVLTGNVQYTAAEQADIDQLGSLVSFREQRIYVKAMEPIAYGKLISIVASGGKLSAWLADATNLARPAHAICDVPGGLATDGFGSAIFMTGKSTAIAGTAIGTTYYLSTAGSIQATAPTADSVLCQIVAVGLGDPGIYLDIELVGKRVCRTYKTNSTNLRTQYTDGTFTDAAV